MVTASSEEAALRCPSAQPGMTEVQVLAVRSGTADAPELLYLNETVAATPDLLRLADPLPPGRIFRLAAKCERSKCAHFDGSHCQLAARIVKLMPEVSGELPPCIIRPRCRWFQQEGRAACLRCSQIVTANAEPDDRLRDIAGVVAAKQHANP
jgi:hypothetical protein